MKNWVGIVFLDYLFVQVWSPAASLSSHGFSDPSLGLVLTGELVGNVTRPRALVAIQVVASGEIGDRG